LSLRKQCDSSESCCRSSSSGAAADDANTTSGLLDTETPSTGSNAGANAHTDPHDDTTVDTSQQPSTQAGAAAGRTPPGSSAPLKRGRGRPPNIPRAGPPSPPRQRTPPPSNPSNAAKSTADYSTNLAAQLALIFAKLDDVTAQLNERIAALESRGNPAGRSTPAETATSYDSIVSISTTGGEEERDKRKRKSNDERIPETPATGTSTPVPKYKDRPRDVRKLPVYNGESAYEIWWHRIIAILANYDINVPDKIGLIEACLEGKAREFVPSGKLSRFTTSVLRMRLKNISTRRFRINGIGVENFEGVNKAQMKQ
jgi:hypothetical protein